MGFIKERPKHFRSLREEFIYDLNERLEEEKYRNWKKWNGWKENDNYSEAKKIRDYSLLN